MKLLATLPLALKPRIGPYDGLPYPEIVVLTPSVAARGFTETYVMRPENALKLWRKDVKQRYTLSGVPDVLAPYFGE